jgi:transcriptional regulator GlxA family with amidase domain
MKAGIVLTRGHRMISVAAILEVLEAVNRIYKEEGQRPFFEISFIQNNEPAPGVYGEYAIHTSNETGYDLILLPSFKAEGLQQYAASNHDYIPWLKQQYQHGANIASFCTGAFLLAATGLLNDKPATTHIQAEQAFAKTFPSVIIAADAVMTEQDRLFTSGGATNSFHLLVRLVELFCNRQIAVYIAKLFSVDMDRTRQKYFGTFTPTENHEDDLVKQVQQGIKNKFRDVNSIEELITDIPASRRNLVRRFKLVTGITPIEYLQRTRVEAAKQLLERSRQSVLEVMLESGYNDFKSFRLIFKKNVGMTPTAYRKKFESRYS